MHRQDIHADIIYVNIRGVIDCMYRSHVCCLSRTDILRHFGIVNLSATFTDNWQWYIHVALIDSVWSILEDQGTLRMLADLISRTEKSRQSPASLLVPIIIWVKPRWCRLVIKTVVFIRVGTWKEVRLVFFISWPQCKDINQRTRTLNDQDNEESL